VKKKSPLGWVVSRLIGESDLIDEAYGIRPPHETQQWIEKEEPNIPVRAAWLLARYQALAADDVLGLVRARDRLLRRLFEGGLSASRDLPSFLRISSVSSNDAIQLDATLKKLGDLHKSVAKWLEKYPNNGCYINAYFAFAHARLGDHEAATKLLKPRARGVQSASGHVDPAAGAGCGAEAHWSLSRGMRIPEFSRAPRTPRTSLPSNAADRMPR